MFPVCSSVRAWVKIDICVFLTEFDQTSNTNGLWGKTNALHLGVKKWRVEVTLGSIVPQNALFGFIVISCWRRHSSRQSLNHHLVSLICSCSNKCAWSTMRRIRRIGCPQGKLTSHRRQTSLYVLFGFLSSWARRQQLCIAFLINSLTRSAVVGLQTSANCHHFYAPCPLDLCHSIFAFAASIFGPSGLNSACGIDTQRCSVAASYNDVHYVSPWWRLYDVVSQPIKVQTKRSLR